MRGGVLKFEIKDFENLKTEFLPVRGGVLKSKEYVEDAKEFIPPRAGRCIEILKIMVKSCHFIIPPRAGRCIEITAGRSIKEFSRIPPRAGRCIEIICGDISSRILNSSPCGEVY